MKKLVILVAVIAFYSCGSSKKSTNNGTTESTSVATEQVIPPSSVETPKPPPMPAKRQRVQQLKVDKSFQFDAKLNSNFTINSVAVNGDVLVVNVRYSGGCKPHQFDLTTPLMLAKSNPPQLDLFVTHNDNGETCREVMKEGIMFDISALKEYATNEIVLKINNSETVTYKFTK